MRTYWSTLLVLTSLSLAACSPPIPGTQSNAEADPSDAHETPLEAVLTDSAPNPLQFGHTPEASELPSNTPPVEKFVSLSKKDLAQRLQIDVNEIALVKTAEMVWPNAALGCPAPGKVYTKGRVPGFQVWLESGGIKYIYNTDLSGRIILCVSENPDGSIVPFSTAGPEIGVPIK
jgi:hypothetical protein